MKNYDEYEIAFLGGLFPKEIEIEVLKKSKGTVQLAANSFQWSLIEGLESNIMKPLRLFNTMFVGSYPRRYRDVLVKGFTFSHTYGAEDINIGYLNFSIIKQFHIPMVLKRTLGDWVSKDRDKKKVLIIYSVQHSFMQLVRFLKLKDENLHICVTVNDLPIFTSMHKMNNIFYSLARSRTMKAFRKAIKLIDSFMLVTEPMCKYLGIEDKPYVIVEGMVTQGSDILNNSTKQSDEKTKRIVYTGTLTKKYGILDLISAFRLLRSEEYKLIICGDGEAKETVINAAKEDKRIEYLGTQPHDTVLDIQRKASVLVNPRKNNEEYTRYSFPWKLIEYMLSGNPVICYKLDGIPDEYDDFLVYVEDGSPLVLASKIEEICSMSSSERNTLGRRNREFILREKNNVIQTKKIIDMIFRNRSIDAFGCDHHDK